MCFEADSLKLEECIIEGNEASRRGGGLITTSLGTPARIELLRCTLHENIAEALGEPGGGGIFADEGTVNLINCIVTANNGGGLVASPVAVEGVILSDYCDVWGNIPIDYSQCDAGEHSFAGDPLFCGTPTEDPPDFHPRDITRPSPWYTLYEISPCNGTGLGGYDVGAGWVGCYSVDNVIFYDNFSDQTDDGWTQEEEWLGQVQVEEGEYSINSYSGAARSFVTDLSAGDLEFSIDVKAMDTSYGGETRIFFRMDPIAEAMYMLGIRIEDQAGSLERIDNSGSTLLAEFTCPVTVEIWNTLTITAIGGQLTGIWSTEDGFHEELFNLEDTDPLPAGTIGLGAAWLFSGGSRGAQHTHFDHVMVRSLDNSAVEIEHGLTGSISRFLVRPTPNPSHGSVTFTIRGESPGDAVGRSWDLKLNIYNVMGQRVRTVSWPESSRELCWDGLDRHGRQLPSGALFWRLEDSITRAAGRLMVIR